MSLQRKNTFKIVGTLTDITKTTQGMHTSNGMPYIHATLLIRSSINNEMNDFEIDFWANQNTATGKANPTYSTLMSIEKYKGQRVSVTGRIVENRFYSARRNQVSSSQRLSGSFISLAKATDIDAATWEVSGFVYESLTERKNKNNEIYAYELKLGQSNYQGNNMSIMTFQINPAQMAIAKGAGNYQKGQTVDLHGILNFKVTQTTKTENSEGGFGEPITRTYTDTIRNYYISGGSAPYTDDTRYDNDTIHALVESYNAETVNIEEKGKERAASVASTEDASQSAITSSQASLV